MNVGYLLARSPPRPPLISNSSSRISTVRDATRTAPIQREGPGAAPAITTATEPSCAENKQQPGCCPNSRPLRVERTVSPVKEHRGKKHNCRRRPQREVADDVPVRQQTTLAADTLPSFKARGATEAACVRRRSAAAGISPSSFSPLPTSSSPRALSLLRPPPLCVVWCNFLPGPVARCP